ncbi:recombination protein NinG [Escherichia coli]|nr:recombination protein NinG [Escherichia coli]
MRIYRRKCKCCNEWFIPKYQNQYWCNEICGTKIALERRSKEREKAEKAEKAAEKKRRREEQKQKDKLKIQKLALKPRSYWIKQAQQAQQAVHAFIRERDRDLPCISCGTLTSAQWDAGHYRTTAAAPQLRFDERNIHKQCVVCNQHKSGNLVPYRVELISRIGQEAVEEIESNHNRYRWTVEECRAIKAEYQQKLKKLRNSRSEVA